MTASTNQDQALRIRAEAVIPGGMHPWHNMFLSAAMTECDIDAALDAASGAFAALRLQRAALEPVQKLQAFLAPKHARALAGT